MKNVRRALEKQVVKACKVTLGIIGELQDLCSVVTPRRRIHAITADPDDNAILECAVAAGADMVASGDSHLLNLGRWKGIRILSPSEALQEIESQSEC